MHIIYIHEFLCGSVGKFLTEVADFSMCALDNQHLVPIKNTTGHNDHTVNNADNCVSFVHEAGFKVLIHTFLEYGKMVKSSEEDLH